ncbi:MAG: hypothetical protein D6733_05355 [Methanobacteriota archaeon]|nr:MAG: hypothetical protein D6733_05355 [Euryarchaeota archaeon]
MKLVIGLSGRMGAGKGTVADFLIREYGAQCRRYSDILSDLLRRLHLPVERRSLQMMGATLREVFGEDVLVQAMEGDLREAEADVVIVDGVRYPNEVRMLRGFEEGILFFVDAPAKVRFERIRKRGEKGEAEITFEEFLQAERRETERHLDEIREMADYRLDNSGSFEDLYRQVREALKEHGL